MSKSSSRLARVPVTHTAPIAFWPNIGGFEFDPYEEDYPPCDALVFSEPFSEDWDIRGYEA